MKAKKIVAEVISGMHGLRPAKPNELAASPFKPGQIVYWLGEPVTLIRLDVWPRGKNKMWWWVRRYNGYEQHIGEQGLDTDSEKAHEDEMSLAGMVGEFIQLQKVFGGDGIDRSLFRRRARQFLKLRDEDLNIHAARAFMRKHATIKMSEKDLDKFCQSV